MSSLNLNPPIAGAEVVHHLSHRIRLRFREPLTGPQLNQIRHHFQQSCPALAIRVVGSGFGLVIHASDFQLELEISEVYDLLLEAWEAGSLHTVAPPPTVLEIGLEKTRQASIKLLLGLAIAGWILPILPGTPFFLVAWWLGWRPPAEAEETGEEPQPLPRSVSSHS
jgi:hypothetical protein